MKRLLVIGIILLFLFCNTQFTTLSDENSNNLSAKTLYVGGSGPGNYTKIQDAIDNASDGDTVFVYSGKYDLGEEYIFINKSIELIGESRDNTIIAGSNSLIYLNNGNVSIYSFTFEDCLIGCGTEDIDKPVNNIKIINNRICNSTCCLFSYYCKNVTVKENIFLSSDNESLFGIMSSHSKVDIEYNLFSGFMYAILCNNGGIVKSNIIQDNDIGILQIMDSSISYPSIISKNNFMDNNVHASFYFNPYYLYPSLKSIKYASSIYEYNWIKDIITEENKLPNCNNLIRNLYWSGNYWDNWMGIGPKLISGMIILQGFLLDYFIPWINFDWHPAKEPYDIPVPEV